MYEFSTDDKEEGYQKFVDRQIEWGMLDPNVTSALTAATRWVGLSAATTLAIEDTQPVDEGNSQSWQPAATSGASSSSWWQAAEARTASWGWSSSWWESTDSGGQQSSQPAATTAWQTRRAPALRQPLPKDPRVQGNQAPARFWGDGSKREWWEL